MKALLSESICKLTWQFKKLGEKEMAEPTWNELLHVHGRIGDVRCEGLVLRRPLRSVVFLALFMTAPLGLPFQLSAIEMTECGCAPDCGI